MNRTQIKAQIARMHFLRSQQEKLGSIVEHLVRVAGEQAIEADRLEAEICAAIGDTQLSTPHGIATVREDKQTVITDRSALPESMMKQSVTEEPNMQLIEHLLRSGESVPGVTVETTKKVVFR